MNGWKTKPLSTVLKVSIGGVWGGNPGDGEVDVGVLRSTNLGPDGVITLESLAERSITRKQFESRRLDLGDLVLEKSGGGPHTPVGRVGLVGNPQSDIVCSNFMQLMRPDTDQVIPAFLHRYLTYFHVSGGTLDLQNNSTNIRNINTRRFMQLPVPLPPLPEQKRIIALIDQASSKIDAAQANLKLVGKLKDELSRSAVERLFMNAGDDWRFVKLPEVSENLDNLRVPITKKDRTPGSYPYYGASGVVDYVGDFIFTGSALLISEDGANLLARSRPIAFTAEGQYWVNNHAHIVRFEEMATQKYVEHYLNHISIEKWVRGAAQPKLTQRELNSIPIPIPSSVEERARVVEILTEIEASVNGIELSQGSKRESFHQLRSSVLHGAFSGAL